MSDQQARDEASTILIASAHSTSATLGWFWKLVLARPEVYDRLVEEVDRVVGDRPPTAADVPTPSGSRPSARDRSPRGPTSLSGTVRGSASARTWR